ncbi:MAG: TSUP family transporter, partial [Aristaeellaceae bacterium]
GGGPMNLAVLYYFFSMDTKQAAINSILVILLSQLASLGMTLVSGTVPDFAWSIFIAMASAGILGGVLSARLQKKLSAARVDTLFAGLLVVIFLICMYNALKALAIV